MRRVIMVFGLMLGLAAWAGAQGIKYESRAGTSSIRALSIKSTAAPTTGTAAEVLATYSLAAGTLSADNQAVRIAAFFSTAANGNVKAYSLKLNGISGDTCTSRSSTDNNQKVVMTCTIIRTGAATQDWWGTFSTGAIGALSYAGTMAQNTANALDIVAVATTGTSAGDVVFEGWVIELLQP